MDCHGNKIISDEGNKYQVKDGDGTKEVVRDEDDIKGDGKDGDVVEKGKKDEYEYDFVIPKEDDDLDDGMFDANFSKDDVEFLEVRTKFRDDRHKRLKRQSEKEKVAGLERNKATEKEVEKAVETEVEKEEEVEVGDFA